MPSKIVPQKDTTQFPADMVVKPKTKMKETDIFERQARHQRNAQRRKEQSQKALEIVRKRAEPKPRIPKTKGRKKHKDE